MAFCTHCGTENAPGAAFCTKCGQPMAAQPPGCPTRSGSSARTGGAASDCSARYQQQTYAAPAPAAPAAAPRQPMKLELTSLIAGGLLILGGLIGLYRHLLHEPLLYSGGQLFHAEQLRAWKCNRRIQRLGRPLP